MRRLFLAKIANFNIFYAQKHQFKKIPWGGEEKNRGGKNENRGGIAPRWRRACIRAGIKTWACFCEHFPLQYFTKTLRSGKRAFK